MLINVSLTSKTSTDGFVVQSSALTSEGIANIPPVAVPIAIIPSPLRSLRREKSSLKCHNLFLFCMAILVNPIWLLAVCVQK